MIELDEDLQELFRKMTRRPVVEVGEGTRLDRAGLERALPHRDPLLLLDSVSRWDSDQIVAHRHLSPEDPVFGGHFPGHPVWPGVLQIEAIGQAGVLLHRLRSGGEGAPSIALTHVHGARFRRALVPGDDVDVVATCREDGLFFTVVGQCLVAGEVACAAAVSGLA